MKKKNFDEIINLLKLNYKNVSCALNYKNPFELLISTILSAQCTDKQVNKVTPILFKQFPTPLKMSKAKINDLEKIIKSTGFYHNKASSIKETSKILVEKFNSKVPKNLNDLLTLKGVARKTANVVLGEAFNIPSGIVVDTHVKRLSFRLGFTKEKNPLKIEKDLMKIIKEEDWIFFPNALIKHGRTLCKAMKPLCKECFLNNLCPKKEVKL